MPITGTAYFSFQALSVSDFVLLVTVLITDAIPYYCDYTNHCSNIWTSWPYVRYVWILTPISHMCSIWFVVLVGLNRFWAVCKPHTTTVVWSLQRTTIYVISVVLFVVIFNAPRFVEYSIVGGKVVTFCNDSVLVVPEEGFSSKYSSLLEAASDNQTLKDYPRPNFTDVTITDIPDAILRPTDVSSVLEVAVHIYVSSVVDITMETVTNFGSTYSYRVVYKSLLVVIVLVALPLLMLTILTARIVHVLRKQTLRKKITCRATCTATSSDATSPDKRNTMYKDVKTIEVDVTTVAKGNFLSPDMASSNRLSSTSLNLSTTSATESTKNNNKSCSRKSSGDVTFLLIMVVVVAVLANTPLCVFHFARLLEAYRCGDPAFYLENVSKLLVNINSCANFLMYCCFSPRFRKIILYRILFNVTNNCKQKCGGTSRNIHMELAPM